MILDTKKIYQEKIKELKEMFGLKSELALPKIDKVTISAGIGRHRTSKDMVEYIEHNLSQIAGQKPVKTNAKKSIASFKVREGDLVGMKITLRGNQMNDFLNRLINITLPRIRDFRGLTANQFDKFGNLTIGFRDQTAFVEASQDSLEKPFGLAITVSIKNSNIEKSIAMLKAIGFPMHANTSETVSNLGDQKVNR
jgi:large subunit ribosomal protein L5